MRRKSSYNVKGNTQESYKMVSKNTYRQISPEHSKKRVTRAGEAVRQNTATLDDLVVIENWRLAHNKILNDWQSTLRKRIKTAKLKGVVLAQRQKRRVTIFDKLHRLNGMQLSRMHDIAGCRLIFKNIDDIHSFRNSLTSHKFFKHEKTHTDDYIDKPKEDGYRGIHDVWRYQSRPHKDNSWNGLNVEIQYRTQSQHLWATAVETADLIKSSRIKFGDGNEMQKLFFKLSSEIISRAQENLTNEHLSITNADLIEEFQKVDNEINLLRELHSFKVVANFISHRKKSVKAFILIYKDKLMDLYTYKTFQAAQEASLKFEEDENDIVLVRVKSMTELKKAYRNYFGDARDFVKLMKESIKILS